MGRLIDTSNIRVKPQYMQDVMGIAMIRCEDLSRILADAPTVEVISKSDYENRIKADMVAILEELLEEFEKLDPNYECNTYYAAIRDCSNLTQQKIDKLKENINK